MNSFELIETYLPKAVDKYFAEDSKTAILEQGSKFIDVKFDQTGYVKIASMLMDGLSDYYQTQMSSNIDANYAAYAGNVATGSRDGFAIGGTSLSWEIFKLQWCRGKQFRIDYIADEETAGVIIGNAVEEFNRLKVIPEVDACRFSVIADQTSLSLKNRVTEELGGTGTDALTDSNDAKGVIHRFNAAFEWLTDHEVPDEEQIIFVRPAVMTLIRNTAELNKFITQDDYKSASGLTFSVEKYNGRPIIVVPSSRFFTDVDTTSNGYTAASTSKLINYMVVSAKAVVPIRKLEWSKIYGPEQSGLAGFHGYLINYLLYHGVVVPKNKVTGVYVSVEKTAAVSSKSGTLAIDTRAGAVSKAFVLNNYFTTPSGLRGTVIYTEYDSAGSGVAKDGFVLGTQYTISNYTTLAIGTSVTASANNAQGQFALVDVNGYALAVGNQVDLVQNGNS